MASASYLRGLPLPEWTAFVPAGAAALYAKAAAEGLLLDSAKFEVAVLTQLRMQPPENFFAAARYKRGTGEPPCSIGASGRRFWTTFTPG